MKSNSSPRNHLAWGGMAALCLVIAAVALSPYMTFDPRHFNNATARFASESSFRLISLFVHAFTGSLLLLIGPFLFLDRIRLGFPGLHRFAGRLYLVGILFGGISAFIIAPGMISGLSGEFGLIFLGILWLWTGWRGFSNIREGRVAVHREWMMRNFALTFAAVTLRLWLAILIVMLIPRLGSSYGGHFDHLFLEAYRVVMWLSWVPNIIVVEWLIQRRRTTLSNGRDH